ncbi:MAG: efflux RND transporter periplasmic adaptor subunit [Planctomycetaceae bacterium]|nr:efflux RND transporter periplasmic adaptor subunit [Planctomycetaceae bacterium]
MTPATEPPPQPVSSSVHTPSVTSVHRRGRSWIIRALITLLVGGGALVLGMSVFEWLASFKKEPPRQEASIFKTYSVTVFEAQPADLQRVITAFGTARADREVIVAAEVSGQIVEANQLEVGRSVSSPSITEGDDGRSSRLEGDLLVRIDPQTYQERVLQAKKLIAQDDVELKQLTQVNENNKRLLKTDQANLKTAKIEFENAQNLKAQGVGTDTAVRRAELEMRRYEDAVIRLENEIALFDVKKQQILSRRDTHLSDLEIAAINLNRTEVYPPFSGVISEVLIEQGQFAQQGAPLVRLTDPARVEVPISLQLSDYLEVGSRSEKGEPVRVALAENETADPRWFSDPLDTVRQAPEADERTRTVKIYTEVNNLEQDVPLLPGTFVQARILGAVLKDVIVVPRDAVVEGTVFVAVPSTDTTSNENTSPSEQQTVVQRRSVELGRTLQSLVVVESGLQSGDRVVMTNLDVIYDGAQLKIDPDSGVRQLSDELARLRTPQVRIVDAD